MKKKKITNGMVYKILYKLDKLLDQEETNKYLHK